MKSEKRKEKKARQTRSFPSPHFSLYGRTAQALYTSYTRLRAFTRLDGVFCAPRRVDFVHLHGYAVHYWAHSSFFTVHCSLFIVH
jgi:hypothetical protein